MSRRTSTKIDGVSRAQPHRRPGADTPETRTANIRRDRGPDRAGEVLSYQGRGSSGSVKNGILRIYHYETGGVTATVSCQIRTLGEVDQWLRCAFAKVPGGGRGKCGEVYDGM